MRNFSADMMIAPKSMTSGKRSGLRFDNRVQALEQHQTKIEEALRMKGVSFAELRKIGLGEKFNRE